MWRRFMPHSVKSLAFIAVERPGHTAIYPFVVVVLVSSSSRAMSVPLNTKWMVQSTAEICSCYASMFGRTLAIAQLDTSVVQNASTQESTSVRLLTLLPAHLGISRQNSKILVLKLRSSGQGWNFQKAEI
jgi:hypothetical protein